MESEEWERAFTSSILYIELVKQPTVRGRFLRLRQSGKIKTITKEGDTMPAIRISPEELKQKMEQEKFIILDLRQPEVYESS